MNISEIKNQTVIEALETQAKSNKAVFESFGESYWIDIVLKLSCGAYIQLGEFDLQFYDGDVTELMPLQLVQEEFDLSLILNQRIVDVCENYDVNLLLDNQYLFSSSSGPGGNYLWLMKLEEYEFEYGETFVDYFTKEIINV